MYRGSSNNDIARFFRANNIPVTWVLIGANIVTFLITFFAMRAPLSGGPFWWMTFSNATFPRLPWTIATWPLVASLDLLSLIFGCLWAFSMCGSLERSWGTRVYALFMASTAAATALALYLGSLLLRVPVSAQGLWLALAAPTVAWCLINRNEVIRFNFVFMVPAKVLMWFTMAFAWFGVSLSSGHPLIGLFALAGCGAAAWYTTKGRYAYNGYSPNRSKFSVGGGGARSETAARFRDLDGDTPAMNRRRPGFNLLRWWRVRQERKRFEQILRRSGYDVPDDRESRR